ncbi:MAG: hypothetical protein ABI459_10020, partial [Deltaproteobacteria bacterium]
MSIEKLRPDDEAELLRTEKLAAGPVSAREISELSAADRQRADDCLEQCRTNLGQYELIRPYLTPEMIAQIPRIG